RVVRAIGYRSDLRTLVLEEAAGTSLQERLLERRDPGGALRDVARAVASFNLDEVPVTAGRSLAEQLEEVEEAAALLEWVSPSVGGEARSIAAEVREGLEEVPPTPIHRDLKTDHLFLSEEGVTFIDLDSVVLG